jgi:hypothetical protein
MSLKPSVVCVPVKDVLDPLLNRIEKTYNDSFPEVERRDFALVRDLLSDEPRFVIYALLRGDEYVGFITKWTFDDFAYIEHFAIDAAARNGGIGAKAMEQFLAICGTPVVIEVETPNDEMSKRRIGFYERLGFVLDSYVYYQPPYRQGEDGLEMRLMSYGQIDLSDSFDGVKQIIYKHVYDVNI